MNTHPSSIYRRHHSPSRNFIRGGTNTISSLCYNTQVASAADIIPQVGISSAVRITKNLAVCYNIQVALLQQNHSPIWNFIHGGPTLLNLVCSSSSHSGISSTVDQHQSSSSHSGISSTVDQHQSSSSHSGISSTVDQRQSSSSQARISFAAETTNLVVYYNIQVAYNTTKSFPTLEFHPRWTNISH
jgi:hypothetical protein